jgi:hypothetical protein
MITTVKLNMKNLPCPPNNRLNTSLTTLGLSLINLGKAAITSFWKVLKRLGSNYNEIYVTQLSPGLLTNQ